MKNPRIFFGRAMRRGRKAAFFFRAIARLSSAGLPDSADRALLWQGAIPCRAVVDGCQIASLVAVGGQAGGRWHWKPWNAVNV
jgi:hypothetical protein